MISLDTNVLVRFLLDEADAPGGVDADYLKQRKAARRVVHDALTAGTSVYLCDVVLCELVWVLRGAYKVRRVEIVVKLEQLAAAAEVVLQNRAAVTRAIEQYKKGRADFADYLIAETSTDAGASPVYTFDDKALRTAAFRRPVAR